MPDTAWFVGTCVEHQKLREARDGELAWMKVNGRSHDRDVETYLHSQRLQCGVLKANDCGAAEKRSPIQSVVGGEDQSDEVATRLHSASRSDRFNSSAHSPPPINPQQMKLRHAQVDVHHNHWIRPDDRTPRYQIFITREITP